MPDVVKIGVIGPKPYSIGGHDSEDGLRLYLCDKIKKVLLQYKDTASVLGLTGLAIGIESDFASQCDKLDIDYNVYLPYEDMTSQWEKLPGITEEFNKLLKNALNVQVLSDGGFSPRKIWQKNNLIINQCHVLIYVRNNLRIECSSLQLAQKLNKKVIILE